jgi:hypothetical protein
MRTYENNEAGVGLSRVWEVCPVSVNEGTKIMLGLLLEVKAAIHCTFQEAKDLNGRFEVNNAGALEVLRQLADRKRDVRPSQNTKAPFGCPQRNILSYANPNNPIRVL